MTKSDFTTTITVDKSAKEVFDAINNVAAWWHGEIKGNSLKLNDEFDYRFRDMHYSRQRVVELIPGKKIVWLVTESNLSFLKHKSEWTNTHLIFNITEKNGKTEISFSHVGLNPEWECWEACSNGWGALIQQSLKSWIMKGKGVEVF